MQILNHECPLTPVMGSELVRSPRIPQRHRIAFIFSTSRDLSSHRRIPRTNSISPQPSLIPAVIATSGQSRNRDHRCEVVILVSQDTPRHDLPITRTRIYISDQSHLFSLSFSLPKKRKNCQLMASPSHPAANHPPVLLNSA